MRVQYHCYPFPALAYGCCSYSLTLSSPLQAPSRFSLSTSLFHHLNHHQPLLSNPNFLTGNALFLRIQRFCSLSGMSNNKALVERLQRYGVITSSKEAEVMETVDKALFVPDGAAPYDDSPMATGYNATISAPHMLEENLQPGMHALDVGYDGRQGWPEFAPYDAIHVGAAAPEIPQPLIDQLKPGGRMLSPVGNIFQRWWIMLNCEVTKIEPKS
ncbi:hypothetical protein JHK86_015590 [Glycine max]|nr:hypothetical protein JHK86_015590 [Glycine max]